jgi:hypothetical protein
VGLRHEARPSPLAAAAFPEEAVGSVSRIFHPRDLLSQSFALHLLVHPYRLFSFSIMADTTFLFTSESVNEGHPGKSNETTVLVSAVVVKKLQKQSLERKETVAQNANLRRGNANRLVCVFVSFLLLG